MQHTDFKDLTQVINARGTFTPLGVSRSSSVVCDAVSFALQNYFVIDELKALVNQQVSKMTGAQAATVSHCTASAITVAIGAIMAGVDQKKIAALPDTSGMKNSVIIPAIHCVNYGQSILQAIRLSGGKPVLAGNVEGCSLADIEQLIIEQNCCCLMLVSSKLVKMPVIDLAAAVKLAHKYDIAVIIDAAAQDFRVEELLQSAADLVLISAQKYLAAPTAGLILGKKSFVNAVIAQEKGIGRGMKATKESLVGVLAAMHERQSLDLTRWQASQQLKLDDFVQQLELIEGVTCRIEADPTGLPFSRAFIEVDVNLIELSALELASQLKLASPSIWVIDQYAHRGELGFELVDAQAHEIQQIIDKISSLVKVK